VIALIRFDEMPPLAALKPAPLSNVAAIAFFLPTSICFANPSRSHQSQSRVGPITIAGLPVLHAARIV
jgi:hypothetical protein